MNSHIKLPMLFIGLTLIEMALGDQRFNSDQCQRMDEREISEICFNSMAEEIVHLLRSKPMKVPSADFLDRNCEVFLAGESCISDLVEDCVPSDMKESYNVTKIYKVIADLCNPNTEVGQGYREHIDCYNELIINGYESVGRPIGRMEKLFRRYAIAQNYSYEAAENRDKINCLFVDIIATEVGSYVRKGCGEVAKRSLNPGLGLVRGICPESTDIEPIKELFVSYFLTLPRDDDES